MCIFLVQRSELLQDILHLFLRLCQRQAASNDGSKLRPRFKRLATTDERGRTRFSHQCTEATEPQDPRNAIPTVVGRFLVLVTSIDDLEDDAGNERDLANTRLVACALMGGIER